MPPHHELPTRHRAAVAAIVLALLAVGSWVGLTSLGSSLGHADTDVETVLVGGAVVTTIECVRRFADRLTPDPAASTSLDSAAARPLRRRTGHHRATTPNPTRGSGPTRAP